MFGCRSLPAALASFLKRAMTCTARSGSTRSLRTVLIATVRSMPGSKPLYTTPIAPLPRTPWIRYLPIFSGSAMTSRRSALFLQHLDRLREALVHARERASQHADLVLALARELGRLEVAQAHLVGELREVLHALDDHGLQHHVEQGDDQHEHQRVQHHEPAEGLHRALDRQRARHRHDLRRDRFVELPPE